MGAIVRAAALAATVFALAAGGCKKSEPPAATSARSTPSETGSVSAAPPDRAPTPTPDQETPVNVNKPPPVAPAQPLLGTGGMESPVTVNKPPPTAKAPPAQDTARYVAWMSQRGKPVKDTPREAVELRIGDWGFFDHGGGPGQAFDRAGLDKASHAIQPQEQGHWHAFLTTPGLDAAGALKRVAWLFSAGAVSPGPKQPKVTAPTLETAPDGSVKLQGWIAYPPNMSAPMRITITATPTSAKLVNESAKNL
jgi:hypothetical protein